MLITEEAVGINGQLATYVGKSDFAAPRLFMGKRGKKVWTSWAECLPLKLGGQKIVFATHRTQNVQDLKK